MPQNNTDETKTLAILLFSLVFLENAVIFAQMQRFASFWMKTRRISSRRLHLRVAARCVHRFCPFPPWFRVGREIRRENQHWKIKMRFSLNHPPSRVLAAALLRYGVVPLPLEIESAWSNIFQEAATLFCVAATCFYMRQQECFEMWKKWALFAFLAAKKFLKYNIIRK